MPSCAPREEDEKNNFKQMRAFKRAIKSSTQEMNSMASLTEHIGI